MGPVFLRAAGLSLVFISRKPFDFISRSDAIIFSYSSSLEAGQRYVYNLEAIKPAGHGTIARPPSVRSSGEGSLQHLMSGSSLPGTDRSLQQPRHRENSPSAEGNRCVYSNTCILISNHGRAY